MRMASSVSIGHRESVGNLANGVGIRVSLTLAIESSVATIDTSIISITSIATVTNGSISRHKAMAIVNSSNDTMAITMGHLSYGVRLTFC